jgi:hypothetical protein
MAPDTFWISPGPPVPPQNPNAGWYIFTDSKRLTVIHSGPWEGKRVKEFYLFL